MLFSSPAFFVFFVVYLLFHFAIPASYRVFLIIIGSASFYAWWKIEYGWLPFFLTAIAFGGALWMERTSGEAARKRRAIATVVVLFLPLIFFKYTNFFWQDVLGPFTGLREKLFDLPLPLGVSFVTFTLTAYVVDVFRHHFQARTSAKTLLAHVLFFPHLIAGPILRPVELIPQLEHPRAATLRPFVPALAIFSLGLVKKVVFADQIGEFVDAVYAQPGAPNAAAALLAIYGFSVQIYCDFSGYTDMALGLALMLGIKLPNNFFRPYAADSIIDFWRRWHVTLSFWLRDYLYIPLGGNRNGRLQEFRNIMITMTLGGLWHGASWTFVIWGALHGMAVSAVHILNRVLRWSWLSSMPTWVAVLLTFHFVTFAWVFFRAGSVGKALDVLGAPFAGNWGDLPAFVAANSFGLFLVVVFLALHRYDDHRRVKAWVRRVRPEFVWPVILLGWIVAITVSQGSSSKFIYFDF